MRSLAVLFIVGNFLVGGATFAADIPRLPCGGYLDSFLAQNYVLPDLPASAKLVLYSDVKELVDKCDEDSLKALAPNGELDPQRFTANSLSLPDEVIKTIPNRELNPTVDKDGNLKRTIARLKKNFVLSPEQSEALSRAVSSAFHKTRERMKEVTLACKPAIDFRNKIEPVAHQHSSSMCYAFTLSTQLGRLLLSPSELRRDPVSAGHIALVYQSALNKADKYSPFLEAPQSNPGGDFDKALEAVKDYGLCRESEVSSDLKFLKVAKTPADLKVLFPNLSLEQIRGNMSSHPWESVARLLPLACPKPISVKNMRLVSETVKSYKEKPELVRSLQKKLIAGEIVGFSTSSFAGHAMIVVGQEYNPSTQQCDFIVRNSYGKDCGKSVADNHIDEVFSRCDGRGNFIVSASLLAENVNSIHTVQKIDPAPSQEIRKVQTAR